MATAEHYRGWIPPEGAEAASSSHSSLRIYNSLTDRKEVFVPRAGPASKKVTWYSCGPTVYDSAHMGHSRNYVTIDILRRILEDYFGYTILFVMNITDVEDKIVLRARRNHLLSRYQQSATDVTQVKRDADTAVAASISKQEEAMRAVEQQTAEADNAKEQAASSQQQDQGAAGAQHSRKKKAKQAEALSKALQNEKLKLQQLKDVQTKLEHVSEEAKSKADTGDTAGGVQLLISVAGDQLAVWQDSLSKADVTDEKIFTAHAARFEREFWEDMDLLGTRRPTVLTRVTEYMPQIVRYIERIMANGFAYASEAVPAGEANGNDPKPADRSVYFDTAAFEKSGHMYPKLNPWAAGSTALAAEGETNFLTSEKRSPKDFALWKAAKVGEPTWPSPWGRGRPGWHIECSAMASAIIGQGVDIHTGGEDLRFPHHDNELAQAEAYFHAECGCDAQWVNYFMHSGHLCIDGLKMSKSMKNFITIREALTDFTARQLRLMFAMTPWNKEMTFGKTMREEMSAKERIFKHFFQNVDVLLRKHTPILAMEDIELELEQRIDEAKTGVHECLLDNLNTAGAIEALLKLIAATNKYMKQREVVQASDPAGPAPHPYLLRESARFVTHILRVFGISSAGPDGLGFGGPGLTVSAEKLLEVFQDFQSIVAEAPETKEMCSDIDLRTGGELSGSSASHILDVLTDFRTRVRVCAKQHKLKAILEECDRMRDKTVFELGIRMEDRPDGSSVWIAEDPKELAAERDATLRAADASKKAKALAEAEALCAKLEKMARLPCVQEALKSKYSRFEGEGQAANPTHDAAGEPLTADTLKKAKAAADKARKPRAFYDKQVQEKGPNVLQDAQRDVETKRRALEGLRTPSMNGRT